jgi:3'(2'),5'-bisphosphate nucleotidase
MDLRRELAAARRAARRAGQLIMRHYAHAPVGVESKDDGSPVSRADREADAAIRETLRAAFPDDAILSEEHPDEPSRLDRARVWIVDPLDGTRDFLARSGDFCVHVALAADGRPAVSAVHHPTADALYYAVRGAGASCRRGRATERLRVSTASALGAFRVGVSRQNLPPALVRFLETHGLASRAVAAGASVKYLALARGDLDAVVTLTGGEKEWDTCAPELLVTEAGGVVTDGDGQPLRYNQRDLGRPRGIVASNGAVHGELLRLVRPFLPPGGHV